MSLWPEGLSEIWEVVPDKKLDELIKATFGREWSLQQNGEPDHNGSMTYFEVCLDPEVTATVEEWLASPPAGCPGRLHQPGFAESVDIYTSELLAELCNRGILPEGDMKVFVSW